MSFLDDLKGRSIVMIGSTVGFYTSKQLQDMLAPYGITITTKFTSQTTAAFYNPSVVTGDKIQKAHDSGIDMFSYTHVFSKMQELGLDFSKEPLSFQKKKLPTLKDRPFVIIGKFPQSEYGELLKLAEQYGLEKVSSSQVNYLTMSIFINPDNPGSHKELLAHPTPYIFNYKDVIVFLRQQLKSSNNPSNKSPKKSPYQKTIPIPEEYIQPIYEGKYLGTHPYYFSNIAPVLEQGTHPVCLTTYYGFGYRELNNALQGVGGMSLGQLEYENRQIIEDLILKIQVEGEVAPKTYRGVSHPDAVSKYMKFKVGDVFVKDAFMSTSRNRKTSEMFAQWDISTSDSILLVFRSINSAKGKYISSMSEEEILYPPRSGFIVKKIEDHPELATLNKTKRIIYADLFVDPIFKTLNTSGKSLQKISRRIGEIRDSKIMNIYPRGF